MAHTVDTAVQTILDEGEVIMWSGKANFSATMAKSVVIGTVLIVIAFVLSFLGGDTVNCKINGRPASAEACRQTLTYIQYGLLAAALLAPLFAYLTWKVTYFAITSHRLLIKSGLIGADIKTIYYDQIKNTFVNVNLVDGPFNTGTILIDTGRIRHTKNRTKPVYDKMSSVDAPYEVYKTLQSSLFNRKDSLRSGRADFENNRDQYEDYVRETERIRRS